MRLYDKLTKLASQHEHFCAIIKFSDRFLVSTMAESSLLNLLRQEKQLSDQILLLRKYTDTAILAVLSV
jgi:hypothetical protein